MSERDIVERLRAEIGGGQLLSWCRPKSALEACDEILRLRAELAARAVPDEEVVRVMARGAYEEWTLSSRGSKPRWTELPARRKEGWLKDERAALRGIRAAGFAVIRTEARDGGK